MKRKLLILPVAALLFTLSACNQKEASYRLYKRYLANLDNNEPISYADWLDSLEGKDGQDGVAPAITIENDHFFIDGVDTGVSVNGVKGETGDKGAKGDQGAKGDKGDAGDDAVTPYELYKSLNPDYDKSETEFYIDLANGNAGEQVFHTVSFTYNGEEILESQSILHGEKAVRPALRHRHPA